MYNIHFRYLIIYLSDYLQFQAEDAADDDFVGVYHEVTELLRFATEKLGAMTKLVKSAIYHIFMLEFIAEITDIVINSKIPSAYKHWNMPINIDDTATWQCNDIVYKNGLTAFLLIHNSQYVLNVNYCSMDCWSTEYGIRE